MSNQVKLIVVATIDPQETESFNTYIKGLTHCYYQVGAQTVAHYPIERTYLGNTRPDFVSVISFESQTAFDAVYKSEAYQNLLKSRDKAFQTIEVYIAKG